MNKMLESFIERFSKDVLSGNGAIFLGSGISCKAGYSSWKSFLEDEAKQIGLDVNEEEHDLISLAQFIENKIKRSTISNKIKRIFGEEKEILNSHKILSSLPINTYWTTNYDPLIELTFKHRNTKYLVYDNDQSLAQKQGDSKVFVYKMHGTYSKPKNVVISKTDYERYSVTHEMFLSHFKTFLSSKTFLFMGYSFSDPNISHVLSRIKLIYKKSRRDHYWIFEKPKQKIDETPKSYNYKMIRYRLFKSDIKNYGINIIEIDDYDKLDGILEKIRERVNSKNVLLSGSVEDSNPNSNQIFKFSEILAKTLIEKGFKIYTGFGKNIGSYIVKGAFAGCESIGKSFNDVVKLFPFPYNADFTLEERKTQYTKLRLNMIAPTCSTIVICGEKQVHGEMHLADGVNEELNLSINQKNLIIPIVSTGGIAAEYAKINNIKIDEFNDLRDINHVVEKIVNQLNK